MPFGIEATPRILEVNTRRNEGREMVGFEDVLGCISYVCLKYPVVCGTIDGVLFCAMIWYFLYSCSIQLLFRLDHWLDLQLPRHSDDFQTK